MSVLTKSKIKKEKEFWALRQPKECFLCGESLFESKEYSTGAFIYWEGQTGHIALHQFCAEQMGINLIQDARSSAAISKKRCKVKTTKIVDASNLWFVK